MEKIKVEFMSNHTKLDRAYSNLIDCCNTVVLLATAIASNANYKESVQAATDPLINDCYKEATRLRSTLQDVLRHQSRENAKSMLV